jgi:hypothetical protein
MFPMQVPYFVAKLKAHDKIKSQLMYILDRHKFTINDEDHAYISRSDWFVDPGQTREYWNVLYPHVAEHIKELMNSIGTTHYKFTNYWFNHYEKTNYLNWHRHETSGWSSVYYLKLSDKNQATLLKNPIDGSVFQPDVEEGDILTFPGIIYHSSPALVSEQPKTIIAFNVS